MTYGKCNCGKSLNLREFVKMQDCKILEGLIKHMDSGVNLLLIFGDICSLSIKG